MTSIKRSTPIRPSRTSCLSCSMASMPRIYQNVGIPAAPVFNFLRTAKPLFSGNLRQKYDSYVTDDLDLLGVGRFQPNRDSQVGMDARVGGVVDVGGRGLRFVAFHVWRLFFRRPDAAVGITCHDIPGDFLQGAVALVIPRFFLGVF